MSYQVDTPNGKELLIDNPLLQIKQNTNLDKTNNDRELYGTSIDIVKVAMIDAYYGINDEIKELNNPKSLKNCEYCYDSVNDMVLCVQFLSNLQYGSVADGEIDFVGSYDINLCKKLAYPTWNANLHVKEQFYQDGTNIMIYDKILYSKIGGNIKTHQDKITLKNFNDKVYGNMRGEDLINYLLDNTGPNDKPVFVTTLSSLIDTFIKKNINDEYLKEIKLLKSKLGIKKISDITNTTNTYFNDDNKKLIKQLTEFKKRVTRLLGMFDTPLDILRNIVKLVWVPRKFLFRPCYNYNSINYDKCDFNKPVTALGKRYESYIKKFPKYILPENINDVKLSDWNFPFTRIGYTYDVQNTMTNNIDAKIGVTEYILFNGTPYQVLKTLSIEDFVDILLDVFDNNNTVVNDNELIQLVKKNMVVNSGGYIRYRHKIG